MAISWPSPIVTLTPTLTQSHINLDPIPDPTRQANSKFTIASEVTVRTRGGGVEHVDQAMKHTLHK